MADDSADPFARLGKPDAVSGPSPGQTFVGVLLGVGLASVGLDIGNRLAFAALGGVGVGLAVWAWRLRRWRLAVCPGGCGGGGWRFARADSCSCEPVALRNSGGPTCWR